jgi:hypothetical protein
MRRGKKKIKKKTGRPARGGGHRMTLDPSEHFKKKIKKNKKNLKTKNISKLKELETEPKRNER